MDAIHPVGVALVAAAGFLPGFLFGFLLGGHSIVKQVRALASQAEAPEPAPYQMGSAEQSLDIREVTQRYVQSQEAALEQSEVELIKRVGEAWVRIGSRHPDHPDVHNVRAGLEPGVFVRGEHPDA